MNNLEEKVRNLILKELENTFSKVSFNEECHIYSYDGKKLNKSVSNLVSTLYHVDSKSIAKNYAKKHKVDVEYVIKKWNQVSKEATDHGTMVHKFAEKIARFSKEDIKKYNLDYYQNNAHYNGVINYEFYIRSKGWIPLAEELQMVYLYKDIPLFGGMLDRLFFRLIYDDDTGEYKNFEILISDYKTSKEIHEKHYENLSEPFPFLPCNSYGKYTVQQNLYAVMLRQCKYISDNISEVHLVWLTPFKKEGFVTINIKPYNHETLKLISSVSLPIIEEHYTNI